MKDDLIPFGAKTDNMKDLGLSYEAAMHGVQSAIKYKMENNLTKSVDLKHLRVGIDGSKADMLGLVELLISKGVFTSEEYLEYLRRSANNELHMHEEEVRAKIGNKNISFR